MKENIPLFIAEGSSNHGQNLLLILEIIKANNSDVVIRGYIN